MPVAVELTGDDLTIGDVWDVAVNRRQATLGVRGRDRAEAARALLETQAGDHTYGVNTGFGRFVSETIPEEASEELQLRLLPVPESPQAPLGPPRTVLTEKSETWVNVLLAPRFLPRPKREGLKEGVFCQNRGRTINRMSVKEIPAARVNGPGRVVLFLPFCDGGPVPQG